MAVEFVDTNVFCRFLAADDPDQSPRAASFLREVETGTRTATTCEGVLVETVQVLSSKRTYNLPRDQIRNALAELIGMRGLRLPRKSLYQRALDIYATTSVDFVDALCAAHMDAGGLRTLVSFDRGLDRIPGISRRET